VPGEKEGTAQGDGVKDKKKRKRILFIIVVGALVLAAHHIDFVEPSCITANAFQLFERGESG
jgi:hypothetical protein